MHTAVLPPIGELIDGIEYGLIVAVGVHLVGHGPPHQVTVSTSATAPLRAAQAVCSVIRAPIASVWNSDRIGAATVFGEAVADSAAGLSSS
jgi:hypothetical protein